MGREALIDNVRAVLDLRVVTEHKLLCSLQLRVHPFVLWCALEEKGQHHPSFAMGVVKPSVHQR